MNPPQILLGCTTLNGFEHFNSPFHGQNYPGVLTSLPIPNASLPDISQRSSNPATSPSSELGALSLKAPTCPQCKGQKYGFTAYFHNTSIFTSPPHDLLRLIEKSYILRERLKSFLVTYTMREVEQDRIPTIEAGINAWQQEIIYLVKDVICAAGFELDFAPLEEAKMWAFEKAGMLRDHVWGRVGMGMPKGNLLAILAEFRKVWEAVWLGFLRDQGLARDALRKAQDWGLSDMIDEPGC